MPKLDDESIITFMHTLMDSADSIAAHHFKQAYKSEIKMDKTPVTEADQKIECTIRALIQNTFPDHGIQGEEFGDENADAEYVWVIDPIDGTKAFMAGKPTFTTLIGLLKNNKPYAGMVSQAIEMKRWCAVTDSSLRAKRSNPSLPLKEDKLPRGNNKCLHIATTSMGYFTPKQEQGIKQLEEQGVHITYGGDAYQYMMLAEGKLDAVFDVSLKPHDILPLLPILKNAGIHFQFFDEQGAQSIPTANIVAARKLEHLNLVCKYLQCQ